VGPFIIILPSLLPKKITILPLSLLAFQL